MRKQVNYCDDFTDEQFNNYVMEDGQEVEDSGQASRRNRNRRRNQVG